MKRFFTLLLTALLASTALSAQTPEEILARMDRETDRFDAEGFSMVMEIRLPILGAFATTVYTRGDKYKMVTTVKDETVINWSDGVTDWQYEPSKNEVTIEPRKAGTTSDAESNKKMIDSVTQGYDVRLKGQTDEVWQFRCTKSRDNTDKDDPKNMDLVVSKSTYLPVSIKASMHGVTVTLRDFGVGIDEKDITFDPAQYPGAKITDKR